MDYTVHGILQVIILEWVAIPFSRESSQPRDRTHVFGTAGGFYTVWATREAIVNLMDCYCILESFMFVGHLNLPFFGK